VKDDALQLLQDIIRAPADKWGAIYEPDWTSCNGAGTYIKTVRAATLTKHREGFQISAGGVSFSLRVEDYEGVEEFAESWAAFDRQRKCAQRADDIAKLKAAAGFL